MKHDQNNEPATNVGNYLATLPQEVKATLENLRQAIKAAAPKAEEVISYQVPTYKYHGPLVHFVARKNYCSFIVASKTTLTTFEIDLKAYDTSGTTIHFSVRKPLSASLVKKIVKTRIKENDNAKRAEVASKWSAQYHSDIKPEQINCTGCKSDGVKFGFTEHVCEIRKCNIEKKTPHCAACSMYKCEKLVRFIQLAPQIGTALEALR
ncbi:MAG: DUF1801 domain-containing protein [Candidatus Eisenbacteria bacterium]|nr:DUF1801 domain-containing protein [Candidatus Eisenbacteria bacterium]